MHIQVVTDHFGILNAIFTLLCGAGLVYVLAMLVRKSTLDILKQANDALKVANDEMRNRLTNIENSYHSQEKRLFRVELEAERKGRLLTRAREEIRFLEMAVQIAVPFMAEKSGGEAHYKRIMTVLAELTEFRRRNDAEQDEWQNTRDTTMAWIDGKEDK